MWRTAKSLKVRPSDLLGIEDIPANAYERFEIDTAVSGLGEYIDGKLEELTPGDNPKRRYNSVKDVLATVRGEKAVKKQKPVAKPGAFRKPTFKRKQKKDRPR